MPKPAIHGAGKDRNLMKKALIFGVSGFVGGYLCKELKMHGYTVYGSDIADMPPEGIEYVRADLLDGRQVLEIVQGIQPDFIINLAAISSVGQSWKIPQATMQVNVIGALNILEAARTCKNVPGIMFIGSSEEYAASDIPINEMSPLDANNPYGISKMTQERFAALYRERYGMKIYCVRSFNHTGVGQRDNFVISSWCKQAAEISQSGHSGVMYVGNLNVRRDFSDVRDVVRAYRMIIESDDCTQTYNVGSGRAIMLRELLEYIISLSKQPITVKVEPKLLRPADTQAVCCDHSLLTRNLGWMPEHDIFETVQEMFEQYMRKERS